MTSLITKNPTILGGRPVFRGTRVPIETLFDNLADGLSIDEIVSSYPSLDRDLLVTVLEQACDRLKAGAGPGARRFKPGDAILGN